MPGDLEIAISAKGECDDAQIADDIARCDALSSNAKSQVDALSQSYLDLRKAAFDHSLVASTYETSLAAFRGQLAAYEQALTAYEAELVGRTYTTTALNDEADDLSQVRSTLAGVRTSLTDTFDGLTTESRREEKAKADLMEAIQKLINELSKRLRDFLCKDCSKLRPLIARLRNLLRDVNSIRVSKPSALPDDIPWVPTLPPPPWSGLQGIPGSALVSLPTHIHVLTTGTPTLTGTPDLIYAGQVFPNTIPLEGAPRVCIGQVWWLYRMTASGNPVVLQQVFEGTRGPTFQFLFQRDPPPKVEVEGGFDATDVIVSEDRTRVYFTLHRLGTISTVAKANITITDATGKVVKVHSADPTDDPSPSLNFESDFAKGFAGLLASLGFVAVDSFFERMKADPGVKLDDFRKEMESYTNMFLSVVDRMTERAPDQADELTKPHIDEMLEVLPRLGETMPSGGAIHHMLAEVPAWYDVLSGAHHSGPRGYTGQFADYPNMVLDRAEVWEGVLGFLDM